jgi:acyl transferase domain-containing protein
MQTAVAIGIARLGDPPLVAHNIAAAVSSGSAYVGTGRALSAAAGRLSYVHGLRGPSVTIDTACSSSLVGLHFVRDSIMTAHCYRGIVGGVSLPLTWETTAVFAAAGMLSFDGRCKALDAAADGYVRGEACVVIGLESLTARNSSSDINQTAMVLLGSAVNQDGRSSSLTAPNGPSQQKVLLAASLAASLPIEELNSIEMHGTGTALGDPIEVGAITSLLRRSPTSRHPLRLDAAKSTYGHSETASGLLGVLQGVSKIESLATRGIMHLRRLNPYVTSALDSICATSTCAIPRIVAPTISAGMSIATGASAFAFQGTNAHAITACRDLSGEFNRIAKQSPSIATSYQRRRLWFSPDSSKLLYSVSINRKSQASFDIAFDRAGLSYLWQHQVCYCLLRLA